LKNSKKNVQLNCWWPDELYNRIRLMSSEAAAVHIIDQIRKSVDAGQPFCLVELALIFLVLLFSLLF
jgi:hypothetical protein